MMKSTLVIFLAATTFFSTAKVTYAQPAAPQVSAEVFATVNIYSATIVAQKENVFTLAFDIMNREGVQPGVRYGVSLVKMNGGVITDVADEHVYDETLTLGTGETAHKSITYTAPVSLSGAYSLMLSSKSSSGIPFANVSLGKVTLVGQKESISIDQPSCYLTSSADAAKYTLDALVSLGASDALSLHCTVTNGTKASVTLTPNVSQRLRSAYGDKVGGSTSTEKITVAVGAKTDFVVAISKVTEAQKYSVAVSLSDASHETNTVVFQYALRGAGASIRTLLLDKDAYEKGNTAIISFIWSPLVDMVTKGEYGVSTPLASLVATFSITDGNGVTCGTPITLPLTSSEQFNKVSLPITADCRNPKVQATLSDGANGTLDSQSFAVTSRETPVPLAAPTTNFTIYIIFASIVLVFFLSFILYKRRASLPIIILLLATTLAGGAERAHADSAIIYYMCIPGHACQLATALFVNGSLDKASYSPGQPVTFRVSMTSDDNPKGVTPIAYGNINGGAWSADIFPGTYTPQQLRDGISGSISLGDAPSVSGIVNTSYGSGGYSMKSGSIPLIVSQPVPPAVQIYFQ